MNDRGFWFIVVATVVGTVIAGYILELWKQKMNIVKAEHDVQL